jgi:hypothetical protein
MLLLPDQTILVINVQNHGKGQVYSQADAICAVETGKAFDWGVYKGGVLCEGVIYGAVFFEVFKE